MTTADPDWLAERFEAQRPRLRAVAYRMLGSMAEADDAVQDAWLRLARADAGQVENLGGWLTTVVARLCLDRLRSRTARREDLAGGTPCVRPPRHVRVAVRGDRQDRGADARGGAAAREPGATPGPRLDYPVARVARPPARARQCVPGRGARRRLRGAAAGARPGRRRARRPRLARRPDRPGRGARCPWRLG